MFWCCLPLCVRSRLSLCVFLSFRVVLVLVFRFVFFIVFHCVVVLVFRCLVILPFSHFGSIRVSVQSVTSFVLHWCFFGNGCLLVLGAVDTGALLVLMLMFGYVLRATVIFSLFLSNAVLMVLARRGVRHAHTDIPDFASKNKKTWKTLKRNLPREDSYEAADGDMAGVCRKHLPRPVVFRTGKKRKC